MDYKTMNFYVTQGFTLQVSNFNEFHETMFFLCNKYFKEFSC